MIALREILYKLILYTSPLWLLILGMEYKLGQLENSYSFKVKNFNSVKNTCNTLVLGNSEILKGINPDDLPQEAYNMAHVSQNFTIDARILEKYGAQMPNLKLVILGVSYLSFGDDLETGAEEWRMAFYRKHYGIAQQQRLDVKDYSSIFRYTPYESIKIAGAKFNVNLINGIQSNGWMITSNNNAEDTSKDMAAKKALLHNRGLNTDNIDKNVTALRRMLQYLNERNIKVVLIAPPVMRNYYLNLDKQWLKTNDSIVAAIGEDFEFKSLDFTAPPDSIYNLLEGGFNDVNHLNKSGAEKFGAVIKPILNIN